MARKLENKEIMRELENAENFRLSLAELHRRINITRKKNKLSPVGKTTVNDAAKRLTGKEIILFKNKRYYIQSDDEETNQIIQKTGNILRGLSLKKIYVAHNGKKRKFTFSNNKKIDPDSLSFLQENIDFLKLRDLIYLDHDENLIISPQAASRINICPECYQAVDTLNVHFESHLFEDKSGTILCTNKIHNECIYKFLLKNEVYKGTNKAKEFFKSLFSKIQGGNFKEARCCTHCGLPVSLPLLIMKFINSTYFYSSFNEIDDLPNSILDIVPNNEVDLEMILDMFEEVMGDRHSFAWAEFFRYWIGNRACIIILDKKIEDSSGKVYHPNCFIKNRNQGGD